MVVKVFLFERESKTPNYHGTIYLDTNTFGETEAEKCFHLCNWSCWAEEKPEDNHTDIEVCGHGLVLQTPTESWLALSVGWLKGTSVEISEYVIKHKGWF